MNDAYRQRMLPRLKQELESLDTQIIDLSRTAERCAVGNDPMFSMQRGARVQAQIAELQQGRQQLARRIESYQGDQSWLD